MGQFTDPKVLKNSLFRGTRGMNSEPSWPVGGNGTFPHPPEKDPVTEHLIQDMKQRFFLKIKLGSGFAKTLHVEPPRNDKLFKIRRIVT